MSKIIGYCRVSIDKVQTTENQKLLILDYCHNQKLNIDEIVEVSISSRKDKKFRLIDETIEHCTNNNIISIKNFFI